MTGVFLRALESTNPIVAELASLASDAASDPAAPLATALALAGISLTFGGIRDLQDVSFHVQRGEIRAVIEPNGQENPATST